MSKLFYSDIKEQADRTYSQFVEELKKAKRYNKYCFEQSYYSTFRMIVLSMLYGYEIVLLDSDFSREERTKLTGITDLSTHDIELDSNILSDLNPTNLIERLVNCSKNWKLTIFTSGTTGLPKSVVHTFETLTRFVKRSDNRTDDVWGFAYNPTHMAGLQVFLQALLNGNSIIRLFQLPKDQVFEQIATFQITHISATPTFYRLLLPVNIAPVNSVRRITSGGEKFDSQTIEQLQQVFCQAKITNVYASTEAGTLFAASGNDFLIKGEFMALVKVVDNELWLHKSLMGSSDSIALRGDWYATGDVVQVVAENPLSIRFLSRKNEIINVGGYKVNPSEVEESLCAIKGVGQARVYGKSNALLGNIVCAEVVLTDPSLNESLIRSVLAEKLQEYKIPRIIKFCDRFEQTRSGKIKR